MSRKLFFLLFGTLLLTVCILADSTEESNSSEEESRSKLRLINEVTNLFDTFLDSTISAIRKYFEPVIKDSESQKLTVEPRAGEKLKELKAVLEKSTQSNMSIHQKQLIIVEAVPIFENIRKIETELMNDATDDDVVLQYALENFEKELRKTSETFTTDSYKELEKYWNSINYVPKEEITTVKDKMTALENSPAAKTLEDLLEMFGGVVHKKE